jgi:hypothetical protein
MRRMTMGASILFVLSSLSAGAQVSVLTHHNDNLRTGANLQETALTVAKVTKATFGKLAYRIVDGDIYAQPLLVSDAKGPDGTKRTMAIVATESNSVYAFDADNVSQLSNAQLWVRPLGPAIPYQELYEALGVGAHGCTDITLQIGITSTPAIMLANDEPRSGVVFVTAKTGHDASYSYSLYSLDLATGKPLGSTAIQGEVPGQGIGSTGSGAAATIVFNPLYQLSRPALTLAGKTLFVAFGGHCDTGPYHGWVFAYDVSDPRALKQVAVFCVTPNGKGPQRNNQYVEGLGGIWMSGEGIAVDESGDLYLATANGTYNGTTDFSDSVLRLRFDGSSLRMIDWFTPQNQNELKDLDYDLGSGGVALIPNSHLAIAGGKEGRIYLLDRNHLGKGTKVALQSLQVTHNPVPANKLAYNIHGTPVLWVRQNEIYVYVMGEEDPLKQFRLVPDVAGAGWKFDPAGPYKISPESAPYPNYPTGAFSPNRTEPIWMPGGFMTISADGVQNGSGILWVNMPFDDNANHMVVRGILRAYDATDVSKGEIWDSESTGRDSDRLGQFAKFCPPAVANGKVYVATFQEETVLSTGAHIKANVGDQPALVIYGPLSN